MATDDKDAPLVHSPFRKLDPQQLIKKQTKTRTKTEQQDEKPTPPRSAKKVPEQELFAREMEAVRPIKRDNYIARSKTAPPVAARDPDAEVMAELAELISGDGTFDMTWTEEHVEGLANGVDRRLLRALRKGSFSYTAYVDLHGLTRKEAQVRVKQFLAESRRTGDRCVLIIHGRGLNSEDRVPVIKESLTRWLTRGSISRFVLAFCSARPPDGGLGAVYVLLRK